MTVRLYYPIALAMLAVPVREPLAGPAPAGVNPPPPLFVGSGAGCNFNSIQAAVDAARIAPGPDTILVADNRSYTAQEIRVEDPAALTIAGGISSCTALYTSAVPVLSGAGGNPRSVITHVGSGSLMLDQLEIAGGDAVAAAGGVHSDTAAPLLLRNVTFSGNRGVAGGGLLASAPPGSLKTVQFDGLVRFHGNRAGTDGGAFFAANTRIASGPGNLRMEVDDNHAEAGSGGGFYLLNSDLRPDYQCSAGPLFSRNSASDTGGALFVHARGATSEAMFRSSRPQCSRAFVNNRAGVSGGAVQVLADGSSDAPVTSLSQALVSFYDASFHGNTAPEGAAFMVDSREAGDRTAVALAAISSVGHPNAAPCEDETYCTLMQANDSRVRPGDTRAPTGLSQVSSGAALRVRAQPGAEAHMLLSHVALIDNVVGHTLRASGAGAELVVADSLVAANPSDAEAIALDGGATGMLLDSTVVETQIGGATAVVADRHVVLSRSIVMTPGRAVLRLRQGDNTAVLLDMLIHDGAVAATPDLFAPAQQIRVRAVADPGFVAGGAGDFHLRPDSPAVDAWQLPAGEPAMIDLDQRPRGVDHPDVAGAGSYDLGAFELQPFIFADGFEPFDEIR